MTHQTPPPQSPRTAFRGYPRAFLLLDTLIGLLLLATLASLLAITLTQTTRANNRLADSRAATRLAEQTLLTLQSNLPQNPLPENAHLTLIKLPNQPGPRAWVRLTATLNNRSSTLYALLHTPLADQASTQYPEDPHP
ncbi:MAG TPA: hypothetical protein VFE58_09555 [Tepidisphaeraceae bacterium]|nr:hypothetical protein [Tepidisphaeraceae bacterium]